MSILNFLSSLVLAASSSSNQYTPTFPGAIIAWLICNGRKRQEIGGWLLFYYWQLYSGVLLSIIFLAIGFQSYVPESFEDVNTYYLFIVSIVPSLLILGLELAVGTILISVRTWDMLRLLRWLMVAGVIAAGLGTLIDIKYFPDNIGFDAITLIPEILWLAYFFKSRRVIHVFKSHDWSIVVNTIYPPKPGVVI